MHIRSYTITLMQSGKEIVNLDLDARNKKEAEDLGKSISVAISTRLVAHYGAMGLVTKNNPPRIKVHVSNYQPKVK